MAEQATARAPPPARDERLQLVTELLRIVPKGRSFRVHGDGSVSVYPAPNRRHQHAELKKPSMEPAVDAGCRRAARPSRQRRHAARAERRAAAEQAAAAAAQAAPAAPHLSPQPPVMLRAAAPAFTLPTPPTVAAALSASSASSAIIAAPAAVTAPPLAGVRRRDADEAAPTDDKLQAAASYAARAMKAARADDKLDEVLIVRSTRAPSPLRAEPQAAVEYGGPRLAPCSYSKEQGWLSARRG